MALAARLYGTSYRSHVLELNASDDRGIDVVRGQIKAFASTRNMFSTQTDTFKLVILDEADAMTQAAQAALRRVMEQYTRNVRFCIICNYVNKIIPAIQSRCTRFRFSPLDRAQVERRIDSVIAAEHCRIDDRAKAAWLYAQFVTSKTVDVKKSHVGLTFIRESTIQDDSFTERAPMLGGLVEFYRSPARLQWSPTGTNVPDYPKLAQLWWQAIGDASSGAKTAQEAMDSLCAEQERVMERLERAGVQGDIGPKLAEEHDLAWWSNYAAEHGSLAPQPKLENEDPQPETVSYDELVKSWQQ